MAPFANFDADTRVQGEKGLYRCRLSPSWKAWSPLGGYMASIALRAIGAESELTRPLSFQCQFLGVAKFAEVEIEVTALRRGRRTEALQAKIKQEGKYVLTANAWVCRDGLPGLEHNFAEIPKVESFENLQSFSEIAEEFGDWYPCWHEAIDGKPTIWSPDPRPPNWHAWLRLFETPPLNDPFLNAARSVLWLDLMMWNAAVPPHLPWPLPYIAPNLDLSVMFHSVDVQDEWLLCDAHSPIGGNGSIACEGRLWSPSGTLVASANSTLLCISNPDGENP